MQQLQVPFKQWFSGWIPVMAFDGVKPSIKFPCPRPYKIYEIDLVSKQIFTNIWIEKVVTVVS